MKSKVSFLTALAGSCSGISVFYRLRSQSWVRTVFHLVLMGMLCSLLMTWGEVHRKRGVFQAGMKIFESVFGSRILSDDRGLVPEKSPGVERSLKLPNEGLLWYIPSGKLSGTAENLEKFSYLILWAPGGLATAIRSETGRWTAHTMLPGDDRVKLSGSVVMTTSELLKLQLVSKEKWDFDDLESLSVQNLAGTFQGVWMITLFIQNLCLTLFLPVLYTAIFVGMFRLTSHGRYPIHLSLSEFWKIGIYTGFPAMLVATAFPALDLPLFSFSTVYMAGLLIYWLYTTAVIERETAAKESGENEQ
ncbi:MAG: hypothetical protein IKA32_04175 [Lentisphaeria bacterium]|nr:hypothetical protein [Lentisphaeria bacterium]